VDIYPDVSCFQLINGFANFRLSLSGKPQACITHPELDFLIKKCWVKTYSVSRPQQGDLSLSKDNIAYILEKYNLPINLVINWPNKTVFQLKSYKVQDIFN